MTVGKESDEVTLLQSMQSMPSLDAVDDALGWVCLQLAAAKSEKNETDAARLKSEKNCIAARD